MRKFVTEIMLDFSPCNCDSRIISRVVLVQQPHGSDQHPLALSITPKSQKCIRKQMLLVPYSCDQAPSPSWYQIKGVSQVFGVSRIHSILFSLDNYICCQPLCLV